VEEPGALTERQQLKLARVQQLNQRLYRAYLLSQQLREIYRVPLDQAIALLDAWLAWARRSRLQPFVTLARTITEQRPGIEAAIQNGLSDARVEQVNIRLRLITRRASGFHSAHAASRSRCSPSAGSAHHYPAGDTTHGSCRRSPKTGSPADTPASHSETTPSAKPQPKTPAQSSPQQTKNDKHSS
jgi:Transposase